MITFNSIICLFYLVETYNPFEPHILKKCTKQQEQKRRKSLEEFVWFSESFIKSLHW